MLIESKCIEAELTAIARSDAIRNAKKHLKYIRLSKK